MKLAKNSLGAAMYSGANFLAAFYLLHYGSQTDFAIYSFGQIWLGFCQGVFFTLFGSIINKLINIKNEESDKVFSGLSGWGVLIASIFSFVFYFFVDGVPQQDRFAYVSLLLLFLIFGYFRSAALSLCRFELVFWSDFAYAAVVVCSLLVAYFLSFNPFQVVLASQAIAILVSICPFIGLGIFKFGMFGFSRFLNLLKGAGAGAVVVLILNQIFVNSYVYFSNFIYGPEIYAPLAILAFWYRPSGVLLTVVVNNIRPVVTRSIFSAGEYLPVVKRGIVFYSFVVLINFFIGFVLYFFVSPVFSLVLYAVFGFVQLMRGFREFLAVPDESRLNYGFLVRGSLLASVTSVLFCCVIWFYNIDPMFLILAPFVSEACLIFRFLKGGRFE